MIRIQVVLSPDEAEALTRLTTVTLRRPKDEIRLAIRRELTRQGLLPADDRPSAAATPGEDSMFSTGASLLDALAALIDERIAAASKEPADG